MGQIRNLKRSEVLEARAAFFRFPGSAGHSDLSLVVPPAVTLASPLAHSSPPHVCETGLEFTEYFNLCCAHISLSCFLSLLSLLCCCSTNSCDFIHSFCTSNRLDCHSFLLRSSGISHCTLSLHSHGINQKLQHQHSLRPNSNPSSKRKHTIFTTQSGQHKSPVDLPQSLTARLSQLNYQTEP